jgi:undecaprenyl diphosphate synthase
VPGNNKDLKIPVHIGFIMDGNRRWAKERNLPTLEGHRAGLYDALIPLLDACMDRGVKYVTVYAFSTENWDRSKDEIDYLIGLMEDVFTKQIEKMQEKGVRINVIGRITDYPEKTQKLAHEAMERTKDNDKVIFNIALSYGGRDEIVTATRKIIEAGLKPEEVTEERFKEYIFEAGQPDPDVIVRTSGEYRLSGFMLWQSAYAELYFTNVFWPDFNADELDKVIAEYNHRERRFGK